MQLSVVTVKDVIAGKQPEGIWECVLEDAPLIETAIIGQKRAWFRARHFHWKDFLEPCYMRSGDEHDLLRAMNEYESHTHPEPTRCGPTERPNKLSITLFVSVSDSPWLFDKLRSSKITIYDQVLTIHGRVVIRDKQEAQAA